MNQRYADVRDRFLSGEGVRPIAESLGVTRQRVSDILKRQGLSARDGGVRRKTLERRLMVLLDKVVAQDKACLQSFGVTKAEFDRIRKRFPGIRKRYTEHRLNSVHRGIGFEFNLATWSAMWGSKYFQRGRHKGEYVMSRFGDVGPYSPENCFIQTCSQNLSDSRKSVCARKTHDVDSAPCARFV